MWQRSSKKHISVGLAVHDVSSSSGRLQATLAGGTLGGGILGGGAAGGAGGHAGGAGGHAGGGGTDGGKVGGGGDGEMNANCTIGAVIVVTGRPLPERADDMRGESDATNS